jgi:long-chain acyl-CoA synthetase
MHDMTPQAQAPSSPQPQHAPPRACLAQRLEARCAESAAAVALRRRARDQWQDVTWAEAVSDARRVGAGLLRLGVHPGDRVGIMSRTRYEWVTCDWGALMMGAVGVALDEEGLRTQLRAQIEASALRAVIVEDPLALSRLRDALRDAPDLGLSRIIYMDARAARPTPSAGITQGAARPQAVGGASPREQALMLDEVVGWPPPADLTSLDEVLELGQAHLNAAPNCLTEARAAAAALRPDAPASVLYTAGATGAARSVLLSHDNLLWAARTLGDALRCEPSDVHLLSVPLGHWAGRAMLWAGVERGMVTALAPCQADWMEQIGQVKPSVLVDFAPRFERLRAQVWAAHRASWLRRGLLDWSLRAGDGDAGTDADGDAEGLLGGARAWARRGRDALARRVVLRGLRARFGERLRVAVSVGGALAAQARSFFRSLGVSLLETYGLAEAAGVTHIQPLSAGAAGRLGADGEGEGWVGLPLPGVEVQLSEDAEVWVRGPGVALEGAQRNPQGWVQTGDLGALNEAGALCVQGRAAHLLRLADGRLVNPAPIEQRLRAHPLVSQAMIYGHGRPYLTALLTLDPGALCAWAAQAGVEGDCAALTQHQAVFLLVGDLVQRCNRHLTEAEHIGKFAILQAPLTHEAGELTGALQVRRAFAVARYRALLDSFYEAQF